MSELTHKEFASKRTVWNKGKYIPLEQRFWKFVEKGSYCWEWQGEKKTDGYGEIRYKGKHLRAHRISYILHFGDIPKEMYVCHSCDNPSCVNPQHLWLGSLKDNLEDMRKKGRHSRGEKHPHAKLTNKQVEEIRYYYIKNKYYGLQKILAEKYKIGRPEMSDIVNNKKFITT